jgi:AcrR family transcriptional regulator
MGHGSEFEHKRDTALAALLAEPTVEAAAAKVGVSTSSLYRWLARKDFRRQYREARRQVLEAAVGRLQQAASDAVETLVGHLDACKANDSIRAADLILNHAMRGAELLDLAERVEELEAILNGDNDDDD